MSKAEVFEALRGLTLEEFAKVPWMVRLDPSNKNQLTKTSAADACQVRSVSQQRLIRCLGCVDRKSMTQITTALATVLDIPQ